MEQRRDLCRPSYVATRKSVQSITEDKVLGGGCPQAEVGNRPLSELVAASPLYFNGPPLIGPLPD